MSVTFYGYNKCSTCRNARRWLDDHGVDYLFVDITERPPSAAELRKVMAAAGVRVRKLFNTSGQVYRELGVKDRLSGLSDEEALALLASNGRLIKRPIVTDGKRATVGFSTSEFEQTWGG